MHIKRFDIPCRRQIQIKDIAYKLQMRQKNRYAGYLKERQCQLV